MGEAVRRYAAGNGFTRDTIVDPAKPYVLHTNLRQDIEPILDGIKRDQEIMPNTGVNKVAARIPMVVVEQLMHKGIWDDEDAMKKWLNSSEAEPWRIWKGKL